MLTPVKLGVVSDPPALVLIYKIESDDHRGTIKKRKRKIPLRNFTDRTNINKYIETIVKPRHLEYVQDIQIVILRKLLRIIQLVQKGKPIESAVTAVDEEFELEELLNDQQESNEIATSKIQNVTQSLDTEREASLSNQDTGPEPEQEDEPLNNDSESRSKIYEEPEDPEKSEADEFGDESVSFSISLKKKDGNKSITKRLFKSSYETDEEPANDDTFLVDNENLSFFDLCQKVKQRSDETVTIRRNSDELKTGVAASFDVNGDNFLKKHNQSVEPNSSGDGKPNFRTGENMEAFGQQSKKIPSFSSNGRRSFWTPITTDIEIPRPIFTSDDKGADEAKTMTESSDSEPESNSDKDKDVTREEDISESNRTSKHAENSMDGEANQSIEHKVQSIFNLDNFKTGDSSSKITKTSEHPATLFSKPKKEIPIEIKDTGINEIKINPSAELLEDDDFW